MADQHCTSKFCNGCQTDKPVTEWHRNKSSKDGLAMRCKARANTSALAWREANRERHRACTTKLQQQYKQANVNRAPTDSKYCPRCKETQVAAFFPRNPRTFDGLGVYCLVCVRARERERSKTETRLASHKAYAERNKERINARQRRFYASNKEVFYVGNRRRKARLVSVGGSHTAEDIKKLLERQKHRCAYCRRSIKKKRHIDHRVPLKLGGSNDPSNLQALCPKCNLSKGAKDPLHFANSLGLLL